MPMILRFASCVCMNNNEKIKRNSFTSKWLLRRNSTYRPYPHYLLLHRRLDQYLPSTPYLHSIQWWVNLYFLCIVFHHVNVALATLILIEATCRRHNFIVNYSSITDIWHLRKKEHDKCIFIFEKVWNTWNSHRHEYLLVCWLFFSNI